MNRDSRLKPLVETGTVSIGEADESGGGEANRPTSSRTSPMTIKPLNTPVEEIARGLSEAQREVVSFDADCPTATHFFTWTKGKESLVQTTAKARAVCLQLKAKDLMERARGPWWWQLTPLGLAVRTHLEREGGGNG